MMQDSIEKEDCSGRWGSHEVNEVMEEDNKTVLYVFNMENICNIKFGNYLDTIIIGSHLI